MTLNGILQIALYLVLLVLITKPLGWYMARVYQDEPVVLNRVLKPIEKLFYALCGTSESDEMN